MLKLAERRVAGWKDRYYKHVKVINALAARMRRGVFLTLEARQYYEYTNNLFVRYNPDKRSPW